MENSIILFLSSRSRVVLGIDRQIHNATWVSELARASAYLPDAATTELAYWALRRLSLRSPPTKRADSSWRLALRLLDVGRTCRATLIEERVDLTSLRTPTASVRRDFLVRIYVGRKIHRRLVVGGWSERECSFGLILSPSSSPAPCFICMRVRSTNLIDIRNYNRIWAKIWIN